MTGLGTLFIGEARVSASARKAVRLALSRLLRRKRSRTIVQNPDDRAFVIALGAAPETVVLIPGSGVDTEHFTPLPEPPPPVTAAYVGRMLADKGVLTLIEAFALLGKRGTSLQLLLAGDCDRENPGSLAPEQLREFASLYGIQWLGHVADIREVWARAHFAVLASRREGLPKSLLEAAACGRAMVATDAPGCREIAIARRDRAHRARRRCESAWPTPWPSSPATPTCASDSAPMRAVSVESKFSAEAIGRETVALYDKLIAG